MSRLSNVSTILATFNPDVSQLDLAVKSILNQRFSGELEIIIVDDSHDDRVDKYLGVIPSENIRLLRGNGSGLGAAKAAGYGAAKFDYVAHMDADDWSHPLRFSNQIAALRAGVDVCGTNTSYFGDRSGGQTFIECDKAIKFSIPFGTFISHPSVMVNRASIGEDGFYASLDVCEDYELWSRLALKGYVFRNIRQRLLKYRVHSAQATATRQARIDEIASSIRLNYLNSAGFSVRFQQFFNTHALASWKPISSDNVSELWDITLVEARNWGVHPQDTLRIFYAVLGRSLKLSPKLLARTMFFPRFNNIRLDFEIQIKSKLSIMRKIKLEA
jgi:glycosyltransferase involved in cell wall biosynthesis